MKTVILLIALAFTGAHTAFAQGARDESARAHKIAFKRYGKALLQRAYPDVTTIGGPLITIYDSMFGPGISVNHLHFLDDRGKFAVQISAVAMFSSSRLGLEKPSQLDSLAVGDRASYFVAPGATWHPIGNNHRVDVFVGAQAAIGYSNQKTYYSYFQGYADRKERAGHLLTAVLFDASVHLQVKRHFVFGFNATGGPVITGGRGALALFGVSVGRRY